MELSTYFHNLRVLHILHILYILSLGPLTLARPYKQKHALFHNTHTLKDVIFTRNLLQDTRSSRVGCASNCHINHKCRSYFYNKAALRCRTHSDTFTIEDTGRIEEMGWEYYGIRMSSVKRKQAKENANELRTPITTTAPGMGGGLKFAQNVTTTPMPDEDDFTDDEDGDDINTTQGSLESSSERMQQSSEKRESSTRETETNSSSNLTSPEKSHEHYQVNSQTTYLATQPSKAGRDQSSPSDDMEGVTTRTTEAGSKLTIRKVTSSVRTVTTTVEPDSKHGGNTGRTDSQKDTDNPSISTMERSSTNIDHNTDSDNMAYTSPTTKEQTESSDLSTLGESGYYAGVHNAQPTTSHDEDFHDHLGFLSTHEQSAVTEMSTGLVIPGISETDGDEDDESVTIVLMVGDDDDEDEDDENDEDDPDDTSSLIVNAEPDTTMSVITIDSHAHIHGGDDDTGDGVFDGIPLTTDLLGITLQSKSKKNKMSEKSHVMRDVPYAVAKETEALERTKSEATKSHPNSGGSSTANIVALVTIGLVLPIVGIGAYALYRKRKTGSWTLLTRHDDGLGLQLIKTTS